MPESRTLAVVVHWKDMASTRRCLQSLASQRDLEHVVLVDNGSGAPGLSREGALPVTVLRRARNGGFARAANEGAAEALRMGADRLLFLNDDAILEPAALATLGAVLDDVPSAAAAGPEILDSAGRFVRSAGGTLDAATASVRHHRHGAAAGSEAERRLVGFLSFGAVLVRAAAWRAVGPLDEGYFAYYEDADWCLRASGERHALVLEPAARVRHEGSASTGEDSALRNYLVLRGRARFARRHAASWRSVLGRELPREVLSALCRRGPAAALAALRGLRDGVRGEEPASYRGALGLAP